MRRALYLLLGLLPILLTGCDIITDVAGLLQNEETPEPLAAYTAPTPEPFSPEVSTAARIRERGKMIVGIRYDLEPFSYIAEDGLLAGLEIDLARELANRWLGDPEAVIFEQVRSDTAIQHLADGYIDFALAGIIHTQEYEAQADFSPAYFMDGQALLTFPDTNILSLADLGGRRVGVLNWTEGPAALEASAGVTLTTVPYGNFFEVVEALRTRQIDAYADDRHRLERARRMVAGATIVGQYTFEPMALVHLENDPFFADLVATTLMQMAADGTRDALYARWLPQTSPPALPQWPGTPSTPRLQDAPQERTTGDLLAGIQQRGVLEVGYFPDRWPHSADRNDGVQTGFEVRLLERMVENWLGSRQAVTFVPVTEATALQQLQNGELDMLLGGWVHTWEAAQKVAFSHTIFDDGVSLLSLSGAPVETLDALGGQSVGIIAGTAGEAALPGLSQQTGLGFNPITYPDMDAAIAALQQGAVVALLAERGLLLDPFYRIGGFYLPDTRLTYRPLAYVLPKGDSDFQDFVNLTLAQFHANGVYGEIYRIWFDDPIPEPARPWPGQAPFPLLLTP